MNLQLNCEQKPNQNLVILDTKLVQVIVKIKIDLLISKIDKGKPINFQKLQPTPLITSITSTIVTKV